MLALVLSFVAGILLVQQWQVLPEPSWILAIFLCGVILAFFRYWRLLCFFIGLLWAVGFASNRLSNYLPESLQDKPLTVEGRVVGLPQYDEKKVRFDFAILKPSINFPEKIRLSWYFPKQTIKSGQRWRLTVKLKKPHGYINPNGFDYERWLFIKNIGATGYVKNQPAPQLLDAKPVWQSFNSLRQTIADQLSLLAKDSHYIGIIKALTLGERSEISPQQWEVFRHTGTMHLLAISGLHIGLIFGLIYYLVRFIAVRSYATSPQIVATIFAIMAAVFYAAMAGFSIPTQRALIMLLVAMTTVIWQRNILPTHTLLLALLVVLIIDPLAVLSAGFWLSFLAVAVIIYSLAGRIGKPSYWQSTIKINWVASAGLMPILLYYFQQFSIIAPLANFLIIPVISLLVVPLCLIAVLVMLLLPALAQQLFVLVDQILEGVWLVLSAMADMPYATVSIPMIPFYIVPIAMLGVFILLLPRGLPARWLGLVLLLPLLFVKDSKLELGEMTMTLLDVGQGLSAVIETSEHVLVFDTGAKYSKHYDMGMAVVVPFLQSKDIDSIDTLLISHGDNDHKGGAESVIKQIQVEKILTSVPNSFNQFEPIRCQAGQSWIWDQVRFDILSPKATFMSKKNNNSCVLKVTSEQGSILLTGDIEKQAEHWLLENMATQLPSDIMIAPHHGSNTSSSSIFLKQVQPEVILIPAGYRNRFSLPHKKVLQRYSEINARVLNTADEGALVVQMKAPVYEINSSRLKQSKYWNN